MYLNATVSDTRLYVLKQAYMLLALTMIPTVIGAMLGGTAPILNFAVQHPVMFPIGTLLAGFACLYSIAKNENNQIGVMMTLVFAGFMGLSLGPTLALLLKTAKGAEIVAMAAGTTCVIFFALAGYVQTTKKDFSFMGGMLFSSLIGLIVLSIIGIFIQATMFHIILSVFGVLIFSGYILYDVSNAVNGGETNYVRITVNLYLDVMNLFVNLLQLFTNLSGDD
jgi:modulator of FtsH protease